MANPRAVIAVFRMYAAAFVLVLVAVGYWQFVRGDELATDTRNRRYWQTLKSYHRGRILAAKGEELAVSEPVGAEGGGPRRRPIYQRRYPLGEVFCHVVGYTDWRIGESGVEAALNQSLLNLDAAPPEPRSAEEFLWRTLVPPERTGNDVVLTIDAGLQQLADRSLGARRGAVVALDVRTGAVLAMADWPRYDPNTVGERWDELKADDNHPLLARAYQGLYPPGSVFKVLTAAAALQAGAVKESDSFECAGEALVAHSKVRCHVRSGHGHLTFAQGLAKSCNIVFAQTAVKLGAGPFEQALTAMGLDARPNLFAPAADRQKVVARGKIPKGAELTGAMLAASGYGQGSVALSPLHIALLGQMIGNHGVLLEPRLVQRIDTPQGQTVYRLRPSEGRAVMTAATTARVLRLMQAVMAPGGTAAGLHVAGVRVAGKTGSAQNPHGQAHSWFLALAPAEAPRVAVAVIVENGGYGVSVAGPVAMTVLRRALEVVP